MIKFRRLSRKERKEKNSKRDTIEVNSNDGYIVMFTTVKKKTVGGNKKK